MVGPKQLPPDAAVPPMAITVTRNLHKRAKNPSSVSYRARVKVEGMDGRLDLEFDVPRAFIVQKREGTLEEALRAHLRPVAAQQWWERFGRWKVPRAE